MKRSEEEKHVIEADCKTHEMRFCENDHWIKCTATIGIIDLDSGGRRWEGSVVDGNPTATEPSMTKKDERSMRDYR